MHPHEGAVEEGQNREHAQQKLPPHVAAREHPDHPLVALPPVVDQPVILAQEVQLRRHQRDRRDERGGEADPRAHLEEVELHLQVVPLLQAEPRLQHELWPALEQRLQVHEKTAWMLRSLLQN